MGEFENRVFDGIKDLVSIDWENHHWFFEAERFSKIVEEVRKEFPVKNGPVFTDKNILDILIWFDKWFGE